MRLRSLITYSVVLLGLAACAGEDPVTTGAPPSATATSTVPEAAAPTETAPAPPAVEGPSAPNAPAAQEPMPIPATAAQIAAEPGQAGGATEETSAQPAAQDTSPRVIDLGTGSAAPEIELPLFDGETLLLSDLGGKVVVLNFWASWCPPCRWEMPSFEEIWREYKDQDVVFVGIAVSDEEKEARAFAESAGVSYPLGLDAAGEFARAYRVTSLPTTILIDREGNEARKIANVANETVLKLFLKGLIGNGT